MQIVAVKAEQRSGNGIGSDERIIPASEGTSYVKIMINLTFLRHSRKLINVTLLQLKYRTEVRMAYAMNEFFQLPKVQLA